MVPYNEVATHKTSIDRPCNGGKVDGEIMVQLVGECEIEIER